MSPFYLFSSVGAGSQAGQHLHDGPIVFRAGGRTRPRDDGVRRSSADLLKDLDLVFVRFRNGHQDNRVADLLGERGDPGGGAPLSPRAKPSVLPPPRPHANPPSRGSLQGPPQRHDVRSREGRSQFRRRSSHDRTQRRERFRQRQVPRDLEEPIVAEGDNTVRTLLEESKLGLGELPPNRPLDREGHRREGDAGVAEDPRDAADEAHAPPAKFAAETAEHQHDVPIEQGGGDLLLLVRLHVRDGLFVHRGVCLQRTGGEEDPGRHLRHGRMDGIVHRDASRVGWRRDATEDIAAGPSTADERDPGPLVPDAQPPRVRHARASGILGDKGLSFADRYVCRDGNRNTAKESAIRSHLMQDTVPRSGLPRSADAVVVGGGCMGTSIAWHLARRGVRVVVLERTHLAAGATGHSGALVRQHYEARIGIRLARVSLAFFQRFEKETGFSADFRTTGFLCGTRERNLPAFEALVELLRAEGVRAERLAPSEAKTMEPQLEVSDYAAVVHDPDAGYADPIATTHGFAKAAEAEGAKVYGDHEVSSITTRSGSVVGVKIRGAGLLSAERVILAAGDWTRDPVAAITPRLPGRYRPGGSALPRGAPAICPPARIHFDFYGNTYSRPEGEKDTLAGYMNTDPRKTMPGHAFMESVPASTVRDLRTRLAERFPRMTDAQPRGGWTGAYDVTPDSYPILDRTGPDGLFVAVGFSGHGFKLSPAVGPLGAEFLATGKRPEALVPLRASRFAEKQPVHADAPFPAGGRPRIP